MKKELPKNEGLNFIIRISKDENHEDTFNAQSSMFRDNNGKFIEAPPSISREELETLVSAMSKHLSVFIDQLIEANPQVLPKDDDNLPN